MRLLKFGLVGVANTGFGLAIILAALAVGMGDYAANALGYGAGFLLSFLLNRYWTFAVRRPTSGGEMLRFAGAAGVAYAANLAVLAAFRLMGMVDRPVVHLAAMALYSLIFFLLQRWFVFDRAKGDVRVVLARHAPEIVLSGAAVAALVALHGIALSHDVTWQFWIARRMLGGAQLYRDIWEINPPLWFWSAMPFECAGVWLQVPPMRLLVTALVAGGAVSALLVGHLAGFRWAWQRGAVMLAAFWLMVVMPLFDFGQREHIALICALPYAALIARRVSGQAVPVALAAGIGIAGAYGFALKHYFVAIPLMLEGWAALSLRGRGKLVRPETVALAVGALAYGAAVPVLAPAFFTDAVPMVRLAYHGYETSTELLLVRPWTIIWVAIAAVFAVYGGAFGRKAQPVVSALLIVAIGFGLAYLVQRKGWLYHSVPVTGAAALALAIRMSAVDMRRLLPFAVGMAVLAMPMLLPFQTGAYRNFFAAEIDPVLARVPRGEAVFIGAADPMWGWPTVEDHGLVWPSRLYAWWMIPAIGHAQVMGPNPASMQALARRMQGEAATEIRCAAPALILFERQRNYPYQPAAFDVRGFFLGDANLRARVARDYVEMAPTPSLSVYRRKGAGRPERGADCPQWRGER